MDCIGKTTIPTSVTHEFSSSLSDENNKRRKTNSDGSNNDWNHIKMYQSGDKTEFDHNTKIDTNAILFQYMPEILYSFHLLHEDLKLNISLKIQTENLAKV